MSTHKLQYYDNTMLSDYKKCPRMYYLRHERGWRPTGTAMALIFGLCWHEAMDIIWRHYHKFDKKELVTLAMAAFEAKWIEEGCKPFADLDLQDLEMLGARTPNTAEEMLYGYIEKRVLFLENAELVAAERPFAVPLYPDNKYLWYIGRMDKNIIFQGDKIVLEHKTTTEYKVDGGFKTQYVEGWFPNSQCEGYLYASNLEYPGTRYLWVDAALVHKKVHDAFKFIPISSAFANMDNWLWEVRDWISRVQSEQERLAGQPRDRSVMGAFPRNTEQCSGKYGLCAYLNICRSYPNPALLVEPPAGYMVDHWHPFEILKLSEIGMEDDKPELSK